MKEFSRFGQKQNDFIMRIHLIDNHILNTNTNVIHFEDTEIWYIEYAPTLITKENLILLKFINAVDLPKNVIKVVMPKNVIEKITL